MMRIGFVPTLITCCVLATGGRSAAQENPGRAVYLRYSSACHGTDGRGDGVVSTVMRPKPTDLTQLARAHGGKFPYVQVRDTIDGRKRTAAHGTSEMPVWGEIFSREKAAAQPDAHVRGQVQLITDYLSTIQVQ